MTLAVLAAVLLVAAALLQVGLSLGAPWGSIAYGGRMSREDGTLPARFRWMSGLAAALLLLATYLVLARGGVIGSGLSQGLLTWLTWAIVALMILNTIGNLASASRIERYVLGTATLVIAVLCGIIAYRGPEL